MDKYICMVCGYLRSRKKGDSDGELLQILLLKELPDDWTCPICGAGKDQFEKKEN